MHKHIFKPTKSQSDALRKSVKEITVLSGSNFENVLEIGRLLHEAKATLGRGVGVAGFWLDWIETDVGLERRTGQTYHKLYLKFSPSSEKQIAKFKVPYLAQIGTTKLGRFLVLNTKLSKEKKTYLGAVTAIALDKTITLTVKEEGDKRARKIDLADLKLKELNKLITPTTNPKGKKKAGVDVSKSTSVDDVIKVDIRKVNDKNTLKTMYKIIKTAYLQAQQGGGYIKHKMPPVEDVYDITYSDATKPKRARKVAA